MPKEAGELTVAIRRLLDESFGRITHSEARVVLAKDFELAEDPGKRPEGVTADQIKSLSSDIDYSKRDSYRTVMDSLNVNEATAKEVVKYQIAFGPFSAERNYYDVTKNNWKKAIVLPEGVTEASVLKMMSSNDIDYTKNTATRKVMDLLSLENDVARQVVLYIRVHHRKPFAVSKRPDTKNTKAAVAAKVAQQPEPAKRRGRPRKVSEIVAAAKRGRGRPKKSENVVTVASNVAVADVLTIVEQMGGIHAVQKLAAEKRTEVESLRANLEEAEAKAVQYEQIVQAFAELAKRLKAAA